MTALPEVPQDPQPQDPREAARQRRFAEFEQQGARAERDFMTTFRIASREDPELAGRVMSTAKRLGKPAGLVEADLETAQAVLKEDAFSYRDMQQRYPVLLQQLGRTEFVRVAHDDLDNLRATETTSEWLGRNWTKGTNVNELGYIGIRQALGLASKEELQRADEIDMEMARGPKDDDGLIASTTEVLGQMSETLPLAVGVGVAASTVTTPAGGLIAGGATTFTLSGTIGAGNAYRNMIARGIPHNRAIVAAFGAGALEGGLDTASQLVAIGPFSKAITRGVAKGAAKTLTKETARTAWGTFVRDYAKTWAAEVGTEVAQEVTGFAAEELAASGVEGVEDGESLGVRMWEAFEKTAKAMAILSAPGPGLRLMSDAARARSAQEQTKALSDGLQQAAESKVRERDPEGYSEAVTEMHKEKAKAETVYIDGPAFAEVLRQAEKSELEQAAAVAGTTTEKMAAEMPPSGKVLQELRKIAPDVADQIGQAAQRGDDVTMTVGDFQAKFADHDLGRMLAPHVRLDPQGMSAAEAAEVGDATEVAEEASKMVDDEAARAEQWAKESEAIETELRTQLATAGQKPREARRLATYWRGVVEVQAERLGMTPAEFQKLVPLAVQSGEVSGLNKAEVLTKVGKAPRGGFDPKTYRITLAEGADASTFLHEAAHALLTIYGDMAAQKAHPTIVDDFATFTKWAGVKDAETWQAMSLEQQRKAHENFAANFEDWLFDGKAPEPGLQRMFNQFVDWLKRVYVAIRDQLNAAHREEFGEDLLPLTPEIRAVMDRMVAADEAVWTTQAVRGSVPAFQTKEEAGMDDAAWLAYQEKMRAADQAAVTEVQRKSLAAMRWLANAKAGKLRELQGKEKDKREAMRGHVATRIQSLPVYRADRYIRQGEMVAPDGKKVAVQGTHKLDRDMVGGILAPSMSEADLDVAESLMPDEDFLGTELAPESVAPTFAMLPPPKKMAKMRRYVVKGGLHPDAVASMFGFETGDLMIQELMAAPPIEQAIESAIDDAMMAKHSNLADPKKRERIIEHSLHNPARSRFVAAELSALTKGMQSDRVTIAAARQAAEVAIGDRKVRDMNLRTFTMAATRASKEAQAAAAKGDTAKAIAAKRRQLLQEQMAQIAASYDADAMAAKWRRFQKPDEKLSKTRDIDAIYAGQALAATYTLGPPIEGQQRTALVNTGLATMQAEERVLAARMQPFLDRGKRGDDRGQPTAPKGNPIDYRDLTVAEFDELASIGDHLWQTASDRKVMDAEGKKVEIDKAAGEMGAGIVNLPPRNTTAAAGDGQTPGPGTSLILRAWNGLAGLKRVEHWARFMDGGKDGPFQKYLVAPIMRMGTIYRKDSGELTAAYHAMLTERRDASGSKWNAKYRSEALDFTFRGKKELIGALLHAGTDSNLQKLLLGRRGKNGRTWGTLVDDGAGGQRLDTSRWDKAVADAFAAGWLDKGDVEFVRSVWAMYAKFLPLAQKAHRALYGHEFETLEVRALVTPHGTLQGGYVPARVDRDQAAPRIEAASFEDLEADFRYSIGTGKNFTLARNPNYNQPLNLDLGKQLAHIDQELRFIHLQPVVKDALRLIRHKEFAALLGAYDRDATNAMLLPWLDNTARQATSRPSSMPIVDMTATWLRQASSLVALGFNIINAAIQITGLSAAVTQVKGSYMRAALTTWAKNPPAAIATARGKSEFMRQRADVLTRKMREEIDRITSDKLTPTAVTATKQWAGRAAFFLQRTVQGVADVVTWQGGYAQAIAEGKGEADAIEAADAAVRRAQGSQNPEDLAAYEASTPFVKLFSQFGSYSNVMLNQLLSGQPGLRNRLAVFGWALFLPALLEGTIRTALQGGPEDDDKDGTIDEWASVFGRNVLRNTTGLVPAVGPALMALAESEGSRVQAPFTTAIQTAWRGTLAAIDALPGGDVFGVKENGKPDGGTDARSLAALITIATGLPVAAPVRYVVPAQAR